MAWMIIVETLARIILLILIGLSIWSLKIILEKRKVIGSILNQDKDENLFKLVGKGQIDSLKSWLNSHQGIRSDVLSILVDQKNPESAEYAITAFLKQASQKVEKDLSILGTLGSTAPFIGLLGTVLGIIISFGELSQGSTDSLKVMFMLAEALILTAVGLGVAIPAVISFNYFKKKISSLLVECESLKDQYIAFHMRK